MRPVEIIRTAQQVLQQEAEAIISLKQYIDRDFEAAVQLIAGCKGRVVVTGMGKSAIIAQKIVATFNSTGTPAIFMHAADAIHGDLGMIRPEDTLICLSKSGESPEIKVLIPLLKNLDIPLIAIVGNPESFLARQSQYILNTAVTREACPNNLAPTSSTTAQLAMGDALAVCLMELKGFSSGDFARFHPGGMLGKKLYLRVSDLSSQNEKPKVTEKTPLRKVIVEITEKRLGVTAVTDEKGRLTGVITDGDLRRMLEKNLPLESLCAKDIMTRRPKTIGEEELAVNALELMRRYDITQLVVMKDDHYCGIVHLHDLVREGII